MIAPDVLKRAAALIEQRAAERDLPQERSMARAVDAFNVLTGRNLQEPEGWLFMVILKLSRATAGDFVADDLIDAAAYCALALESETTASRTSGMDAVIGGTESF